MAELYALYNVRANKFVITDRSYELLKQIQFLFSHRMLFYAVRVSDVQNYREGLLGKGRYKKLGFADANRLNISTDIHPKSDDKIKLVASDGKNPQHEKFCEIAEFYRDFIREFNKEFGFFAEVTRTRSRTQKIALEQLGDFCKLLMPKDEPLQDLIQFEINYNFSMMKYLRQYKGNVFDILYNIDLEKELKDIKQDIKRAFAEIPITTHPQRYITPKIVEWLDANN